MRIKDLHAGDAFSGFCVLKNAALKQSKQGQMFLTGMLQDTDGEINALFWDYSGPISAKDNGSIVYAVGNVGEYRGALQVTLSDIRLRGADEKVSMGELVPCAPIDPAQTWRDLIEVIKHIEDEDYRKITVEIIDRYKKVFSVMPAGVSKHHAFMHGTLMHTFSMVKMALAIADNYTGFVDKSLLVAATILHDIGKVDELLLAETCLVKEYSVRGNLIGHLVMGAGYVREAGLKENVPEEKIMLLEHMLLSHHGQPEYGAAIVPKIAEAQILSAIDMLDSRMEMFRVALEETPVGQMSEGPVNGLGVRVYHHS